VKRPAAYNATIKEASGLRLLPRLNGVHVVVGSNPTTPTIATKIGGQAT